MTEQSRITISTNVGALSNDFRPWFKVESGHGGITVVGAYYVTESSGTSTVQVVDLGTAGTAIAAAGTIFTAGSHVEVAGIPKTMTAGDKAYIAEGHWVGVNESGLGTSGAISIVSLTYFDGK